MESSKSKPQTQNLSITKVCVMGSPKGTPKHPHPVSTAVHPQTEPRGEKHIFRDCSCKNPKFGVGKPTFTNYFLDFGPTWDVWCQKPNIYELFLGFWTHLGCLVSETQHLRIIFGIWDPPGMFGVGNPTCTNYLCDFGPTPGMLGVGTHFPRKCTKTCSFTRFGSRSEFETGSSQSSGSSGNGAQPALRTLGYSRLRPG